MLILRWRHTRVAAKSAVKVRKIVEAHIKSNGLDPNRCVRQQFACLAYAKFQQVFAESVAVFFLEDTAEFRFAHMAKSGHDRQTHYFREMFFHIVTP